MANVTDVKSDRVKEEWFLDNLVKDRESTLLTQSLLDSSRLCVDLLSPPYTGASLVEKAGNIVNRKKIPKDFVFEKGIDDKTYRTGASDFAIRFALKIGLIFWDNQTKYNATKSLDNIASVTSTFDLPTTDKVLRQLSKLVSYEKETISGKSTPNNLKIVPYLFEDIFPRLKSIKAEDRANVMDNLAIKVKALIYEASKGTRGPYTMKELQEEKIGILEQYAGSIGLKKENGVTNLDIDQIKRIVDGKENWEIPGAYMKYGGPNGGKRGTVKSGTVKIFLPDGGTAFSTDLIRGKSRYEAELLKQFAEGYLKCMLLPGTPTYSINGKAATMLGEFI